MEHLTVATVSTLATAAGWVGAGGTVVAYWLVSTLRLTPDSRAFQGINAVGAGLLAVSAASARSWPSTTVNLTWMLIGIGALLGAGRLLRPRRARPGTPGRRTDLRASIATTRQSGLASTVPRGTRTRSSVALPGRTTRSYRCRSASASRIPCRAGVRSVRQPR